MAPPPKKAKTSSTTISMVVEKWKSNQIEQFSPVQRVYGYPWRLRLYKGDGNWRRLSVVCDKSSEAELWECPARISYSHKFTSWDEGSQERCVLDGDMNEGTEFEVDIVPENDGEEWRSRPVLDPLEPRDGILVIGKEKKKIHVNKESLASQSPFFDRLFNGDFKEKNMKEIPIGDVEYEEFSNIIKMTYGFDGVSLTGENVEKILQLADRFEIKIVEDKVISYLLSSSSSLLILQKLLISEQYNLNFMKKNLLSMNFSNTQLRELSESPEWELLSKETIRVMYRKCCDRLG